MSRKEEQSDKKIIFFNNYKQECNKKFNLTFSPQINKEGKIKLDLFKEFNLKSSSIIDKIIMFSDLLKTKESCFNNDFEKETFNLFYNHLIDLQKNDPSNLSVYFNRERIKYPFHNDSGSISDSEKLFKNYLKNKMLISEELFLNIKNSYHICYKRGNIGTKKGFWLKGISGDISSSNIYRERRQSKKFPNYLVDLYSFEKNVDKELIFDYKYFEVEGDGTNFFKIDVIIQFEEFLRKCETIINEFSKLIMLKNQDENFEIEKFRILNGSAFLLSNGLSEKYTISEFYSLPVEEIGTRYEKLINPRILSNKNLGDFHFYNQNKNKKLFLEFIKDNLENVKKEIDFVEKHYKKEFPFILSDKNNILGFYKRFILKVFFRHYTILEKGDRKFGYGIKVDNALESFEKFEKSFFDNKKFKDYTIEQKQCFLLNYILYINLQPEF